MEHTTSRSTSTEMARSSVTVRVRESETEGRGGHVHGGSEAPERRWRGRERRPEMEEMDERRDGGRSRSGEERLSECTAR